MDLKEIVSVGVNWKIHVAQNRGKWRALLKGVMSVRFQGQMAGPFERGNERSVSETNCGPF